MDGPVTLALIALTLGLTAVFGWAGARPPDPRRGPRLVPYRFLMMLTATVAMLLLVHLLNIAGVKTGGRPPN